MNVKSKNVQELELLLDFYSASGVDCVLDEMPHDRFLEHQTARAERLQRFSGAAMPEPAPSAPARAPAREMPAGETIARPDPRSGPSSGPRSGPHLVAGDFTPDDRAHLPQAAHATVTDAGTMADAAASAAAAETLDDLRAALAAFEGCNLKRTAKNLVFGDGNPKARIMFVGEAPGRDEDIAGLPFVGRSGELLNRMLEAIGLNRDEDVYIANIVPWRPPGNRTPTPLEIGLCRPFIERQIALVGPELLIPLGAPSARELLGTSEGIKKIRGRSRTCTIGGKTMEAIATLHPAYLLRQPAEKRFAWQDFLAIRARLDALLHQASGEGA